MEGLDVQLRKEAQAMLGYVQFLSKYDLEKDKIPVIENIRLQISSFNGDREMLDELCEKLSSIQVQRGAFKKLFKELQICRTDLGGLSTQHQECNEELDYGMSTQKRIFEKVFGMKIKLTADKAVSFEFQHLNPTHLDTTCYVTLDISNERKWEVVHMEPSVSGVQVLLDQLNETNKLHLFCKNIRYKFKELLLSK